MGRGKDPHRGTISFYTRCCRPVDYKPAIFRSALSHVADLTLSVTRQQHSHFIYLNVQCDPTFALFGPLDGANQISGEFEGTGEASPLWRGFFCFREASLVPRQ